MWGQQNRETKETKKEKHFATLTTVDEDITHSRLLGHAEKRGGYILARSHTGIY